jgi:hypothetical protein
MDFSTLKTLENYQILNPFEEEQTQMELYFEEPVEKNNEMTNQSQSVANEETLQGSLYIPTTSQETGEEPKTPEEARKKLMSPGKLYS